MINRVLIRIKVVQLLYSYLLTGNNFSLESSPESPTREKRFAYSLYLDTLYLMTRVASAIEHRGGDRPLLRNRFIRIISADEKIASLAARIRQAGSPFDVVLPSLVESLKASALYKKYVKAEDPVLADDVKFWQDVFGLIIMRNQEYNAVVSSLDLYTMRGVDRMKDMMDTTFTKIMSSHILLSDARKQLAASMDKARELYFRLISLPMELTRLRDLQIDSNRHKLLPTEEDLNPNMKFVENRLALALSENNELASWLSSKKISWLQEDKPFMELILKEVMASDYYKEYMTSGMSSMREDAELWRNIFKYVILGSETFLEELEDKSIFWNDDIEIISTFVLKSFRRLEDGQDHEAILPMFKDEEDSVFGDKLFESVARNRAEYRLILDECIRKDQWDTDRLAFMDTVIIITAIAEILNFPKIPVKVTINEYIEMAKAYSTSKSGVFVNGILGEIVTRLKADGKILKD